MLPLCVSVLMQCGWASCSSEPPCKRRYAISCVTAAGGNLRESRVTAPLCITCPFLTRKQKRRVIQGWGWTIQAVVEGLDHPGV